MVSSDFLDNHFRNNAKRVILLLHRSDARDKDMCKKDLATKANATYSHIHRLLNTMIEEGLIDSVKEGRKRIYTLTEQGERLAQAVVELNDAVLEVED